MSISTKEDIEGRDPALVEGAYTSTRKLGGFRPSQPDVIEAPAKHIHMVSQPVQAPPLEDEPEETVPGDADPGAEAEQETPAEEKTQENE